MGAASQWPVYDEKVIADWMCGAECERKLHFGFGPGLSFKTQFGVIRVDLGFNENGKSQPDFLIGNSF